MAGTWHFSIDIGADLSRVLEVRDAADALVDLTGYTARMQIRASVDAAQTIASLTSDDGLVIGDAAGTITIERTAAQTGDYKAQRAVYDLEIVDPSGVVTRLVEGTVLLKANVTR